MMENKTKIDLKNKSVFITGVAGFIGSNLAKRLLSTVEGVKVVGLDNMNNYYDVRLKEARLKELEQFEKFSFVKGNLADKAVIESIFEQYKPEIVVNLGAQAGVRYSITNPDHPKQNGVVELQSLNFPKRAQFFVSAVPDEKQGDWADHLRGATKMLGEKYRLKVGLSGIIEGSLPIGGLSSSASVIICFLICDFYDTAGGRRRGGTSGTGGSNASADMVHIK